MDGDNTVAECKVVPRAAAKIMISLCAGAPRASLRHNRF
jgi:hypothetical protein